MNDTPSNFDFLKAAYPEIFEKAFRAERFTLNDADAARLYAGMTVEMQIKKLFECDKELSNSKKIDNIPTTYKIMKLCGERQIFDKNILSIFHDIRKDRNIVVHNTREEINIPSVKQLIRKLHVVSKVFFERLNGNKNSVEFNVSLLPEFSLSDKDKKEIIKLKDELKIRDQEIENLQKREKESERVIKQLSLKNDLIVNRIDDLKSENVIKTSLHTAEISYGIANNVVKSVGNATGAIFLDFKFNNRRHIAIKLSYTKDVKRDFYVLEGSYADLEYFKTFTESYHDVNKEMIRTGEYNKVLDSGEVFRPSALLEDFREDLSKLFRFEKGDPGYKSNGHYVIDGEDYMSVWTFKNYVLRNALAYSTKNRYDLHGLSITPNNTNLNSEEGLAMFTRGFKSYISKPDLNVAFENIRIYRVKDLIDFYRPKRASTDRNSVDYHEEYLSLFEFKNKVRSGAIELDVDYVKFNRNNRDIADEFKEMNIPYKYVETNNARFPKVRAYPVSELKKYFRR